MTIQDSTQSFDTIIQSMQTHGMQIPKDKVFIRIENAKNVLYSAMQYFLSKEGKKAEWLPEYDKVAEWLIDNQGRGLFMYGNCGRGKSLLGRFVLPAILLKYSGKITSVYDIQEMNSRVDAVLKKHIISLDDIGTEEISVDYGNKRMAFAEIMDAVEKHGKLIIVSSNLDADSIKKRYGDRIMDRIRATTTRVLFNGESLRG